MPSSSEPRYFFFPIGVTAGTLISPIPGRLWEIHINAVGNSSVITLYDGLSATNPIWTSGPMPATTSPFSVVFGGILYRTGLFMTVTSANSGLTVAYQ